MAAAEGDGPHGPRGGAGGAPVTVRAGTRADMRHVRDMIQELAEYEGVPDEVHLSAADLLEDGFECDPPWFFSLVAECAGELVGHALCTRAYSSWARRSFYVEDLYVRPAARRQGVGLRLFTALCQMAVREGVKRVDWHVLESNAPALSFYGRLGARDLRLTEGRAAMILDAEHIERISRAQH